MALVSILLSLAAVVAAVLGFLTSWVPGVGAALSFFAPALALLGIVFGSLAMSSARREQRPREVAVIGVVLNVLAFFPAVMVAMTCGMCNAMVSTGPVSLHKTFRVRMGIPPLTDAGVDRDRPSRYEPPPIASPPEDDFYPTPIPHPTGQSGAGESSD